MHRISHHSKVSVIFRIAVSILACCCLSCSPKDTPTAPAVNSPRTVVDSLGALRVRGIALVDRQGDTVALSGMSMFESQWGAQYYNANAIKWLRDDWRCTVIRAACGLGSGGYLDNAALATATVSQVIDACIQYGIYVIVDWHDFAAENHLTQAKQFFSTIAKKYAGKPNIIYEIYNEPLNVSWSGVIKPYAVEVIKTIRQFDTTNLIIVGTPNWSQDVDVAALDPIADANVAYTLHFYTGTHRQSLRNKAITAMNRGIPLFVTEFGISQASGTGAIDYAETDTWLRFVADRRLSTCNWSVIDKDESSAALKPGTAPYGNWAASDLTESGTFIRGYIRSVNEALWLALLRK